MTGERRQRFWWVSCLRCPWQQCGEKGSGDREAGTDKKMAGRRQEHTRLSQTSYRTVTLAQAKAGRIYDHLPWVWSRCQGRQAQRGWEEGRGDCFSCFWTSWMTCQWTCDFWFELYPSPESEVCCTVSRIGERERVTHSGGQVLSGVSGNSGSSGQLS